jgi:hypothetical protein
MFSDAGANPAASTILNWSEFRHQRHAGERVGFLEPRHWRVDVLHLVRRLEREHAGDGGGQRQRVADAPVFPLVQRLREQRRLGEVSERSAVTRLCSVVRFRCNGVARLQLRVEPSNGLAPMIRQTGVTGRKLEARTVSASGHFD